MDDLEPSGLRVDQFISSAPDKPVLQNFTPKLDPMRLIHSPKSSSPLLSSSKQKCPNPKNPLFKSSHQLHAIQEDKAPGKTCSDYPSSDDDSSSENFDHGDDDQITAKPASQFLANLFPGLRPKSRLADPSTEEETADPDTKNQVTPEDKAVRSF